MLAKDQKIKTLKQQQETIKKKASNSSGAAFTYVGELYPETRQYLSEEAYDVIKIPMEFSITVTGGLPLYVIKVKDDILLTEEEMKQAESIETTADVIQNAVETVKENAGVLKDTAKGTFTKFFNK